MNRKQRRKTMQVQNRSHGKPKYSLFEIQRAIGIANEMVRASKGHLFVAHLKHRCVFCGLTKRSKKVCAFKMMTFVDRLQVILINPEFYKDHDISGEYYQYGDQYQEIVIPAEIKDEQA